MLKDLPRPSQPRRVGIYARYSSELQNPRSIDDQVVMCRKHLEKMDCVVAAVFSDAAASGSASNRDGLEGLLSAVCNGHLDMVVAEALDRLARDLADVANIFKRLRYHDVGLHTLLEGTVTAMHIAFSGLQAQSFLENLGQKTRRGQEAVVRGGRVAGPVRYGYRQANRVIDGQWVRGLREIVPEEAEVVRRIHTLYLAGRRPESIASLLNTEGIPGPSGGLWRAGSIRDKPSGSGILGADIYRGVIVFGRKRRVRNPDTGRISHRLTPADTWLHKEVPHLRIVPDSVWFEVKSLVEARRRGGGGEHTRTRVFTGLICCVVCGGPFHVKGNGRYYCYNWRAAGVCQNGRGVAAETVEKRAVGVLLKYAEDFGAMRTGGCSDNRRKMLNVCRAEIRQLRAKIHAIVNAVEDGGEAAAFMQRLREHELRLARLRKEEASLRKTPVVGRDGAGRLLQDEIERLASFIDCEHNTPGRDEALRTLRGLIDTIIVSPGDTPRSTHIEVRPLVSALEALFDSVYGV